jgi:putative ABC transport system permease protein
VGLGLASPFARPARTAMTLVALLLGTAAVTFVYGLARTLDHAGDGLSRAGSAQVTVDLRIPRAAPGVIARDEGEGPGPSADPEAVRAALRADPGTGRFTSVTHLEVQVPGRTRPVEVTAYDTDSSWLGYPVVAGRWFRGGGEIVVPTSFLRSSALRLGDEIALEADGRRATVRIVGEVFANDDDHVYADRDTVTGLSPAAPVDAFEVRVGPGTSAEAYAERISGNAAFASGAGSAMPRQEEDGTIAILLALITTLTVLLAVVAGLGVLNTVALDTRERARAIGVLKSLGMTPRQTMVMVVTSVAGIGLVAGVAGIPLGMALHHQVAPAMASAADLRLPGPMLSVYGAPAYAALAASGVVLAVLGAVVPASWAARAKAAAWRTE